MKANVKEAMTKVLVVDDDPDLVAICSLVLESEGYQVDAAMNGCEAIDKFYNSDADLVLMDVMMPALDGLTVCKIVKRDPEARPVPVIIMSASEVLRERSREFADAVLAKPFDIDYLVQTVGSFAPAN
jgi:CheY-like chemotaxis protein